MSKQSLLRSYIRSILLEQKVSKDSIGAVLRDLGDRKSASFYDADNLTQGLLSGKSLEYVAKESVIAFIEIVEPKQPCLGGWKVSLSWGPGYGDLVYGTAYALSPNGILFPDRLSVSPSAMGGWQGIFDRHKEKGIKIIPMDNASDHMNNQPHGANRKKFLKDLGFEDHTEDPEDDCKLYFGSVDPDYYEDYGFLDFYYDASGVVSKYRARLDAAVSKHEEAMSSVQDHVSDLPRGSVEKVEEIIFDNAKQAASSALKGA